MKTSPRFILLDDDPFALELAKKIVREYNRRIEVISFSACKGALDYMEAIYFKGNYPETVLLTDLHMPEMDGFFLLDRVEKIPRVLRARLHIFVLSAAACPDEMKKVLSYSCVTGFYNKPLSTDKVLHLMTCVNSGL